MSQKTGTIFTWYTIFWFLTLIFLSLDATFFFCWIFTITIFTAHIRRMGEGNIFSLCVSSHLDRGCYLPRWGVYTFPGGWGTTLPGRGTPYQNSIACTCYVLDGMPLAFTQEDFLVIYLFRPKRTSSNTFKARDVMTRTSLYALALQTYAVFSFHFYILTFRIRRTRM